MSSSNSNIPRFTVSGSGLFWRPYDPYSFEPCCPKDDPCNDHQLDEDDDMPTPMPQPLPTKSVIDDMYTPPPPNNDVHRKAIDDCIAKKTKEIAIIETLLYLEPSKKEKKALETRLRKVRYDISQLNKLWIS